MSMILMIAGSLLLAAAVVLAFTGSRWASPAAYAGLWAFIGSGNVVIATGQTLFWAAAVVIVLLIDRLLPRAEARSRGGVGYVAGATLAGTLVGLLMSSAGMIIGAAVGAFCGALAYSRTPAGRGLEFPGTRFVEFLGAKGLPAVVTMSIVGLTVCLLVDQRSILQAIE